jgi:hypothetical protein
MATGECTCIPTVVYLFAVEAHFVTHKYNHTYMYTHAPTHPRVPDDYNTALLVEGKRGENGAIEFVVRH